MRERNDFFFGFAAVRSDKKLNVDCICVPDGDASLKTAKLDFQHTAKWVRTRLKQAALVTHDPMLTRAGERASFPLDSGGTLPDERKKLCSGFPIVAKSTEHGAGDRA